MTIVTKKEIRDQVWDEMQSQGVGRFPFPIKGRIPNFKGAEAAAERLAEHPSFLEAKTLKCNPDAPQLPVRLNALRQGKTVYMAVPRLREKECFICLDPKTIDPQNFRKAVSIRGSVKFGKPVAPDALPFIDLIVAGSVAVRKNGTRAGKGGGYSDLEFGIATQLKRVDPKTTIVTTVHDAQLVTGRWKIEPWDIPLDWIFTPSETVRCKNPHARPKGVLWNRLDPDMRRDIPILDELG
ncbi:MAG: 5-formyltetrahydrofolate cyclo-ligase [Candidatus Nitronauta litoralis]|uniref:5-formyltetrahydrofolate cyclo-ligase n=1 Tax=Candidatus Nitronauta litoralis TaxID=2705533 RepID=A0A7T0G0K3_9BACT|nr:MAG: 5-formyltetrahydrofolate cyclo-ligase [Candidatus Nitronauta litoralis]